MRRRFLQANLVGELSRKYNFKDSKEIGAFECADVPSGVEIIKNKIKPIEGDIILVKASQGIRLEKVVQELLLDPFLAQSLLVRQDERWRSK